jgi:hypothetical protein
MTQLYISTVQLESLVVAQIRAAPYSQVLVPSQGAGLATSRLEVIDRNTRWYAGITMAAMGAIDMAAAAPKPQYRQVAVKDFVYRLARINEQGGSFLFIKVTTAVRIGCIDLEVPH